MIKNYLKVAFRYLSKHKGYTFINVSGLAVSIACCILVMLFVKSEWSFDRFHSKSERLYRAWLQEHAEGQLFVNTVTPLPLVPVLQGGVPDIESACRVVSNQTTLIVNNNKFNDPITMVDSNFFAMFDFPLLEGSRENALSTANSAILTQTIAKKYFGNSPALGKNLEIDLNGNKLLFTVAAIVKDPPLESSIQFSTIIPFSNAKHVFSEKALTSAWSNVVAESFFLLKPGADIKTVHERIQRVMDPLVAQSYKPGKYQVQFQPITDIHLNNKLPAASQPVSDPKYAYILSVVGILILIIACINFVTLSVGRSATRALEVGVRKVLGAERIQLMRQFWGEALLLTLMGLFAGVILAFILLKPFGELVNRQMYLPFDAFTFLFLAGLLLVIGLISGIYPAIVLSGFKPIMVLKGKLKTGNMGFFRKGLITGQFTASIIMIIGTVMVGRQLNYLRQKDLGYDREHIIVVPTNKGSEEGNKMGALLRASLQQNPAVKGTSTSLYTMAEYGWMQMGYTDNAKTFRQFQYNRVDASFIPLMNLKIVAGRGFVEGNSGDSNVIVVNEALVREYGWDDPIGKKLPGNFQQTVIGVVKDFHIDDLHSPIKPAVLAIKSADIYKGSSDITYDVAPQPRVSVKFTKGNVQEHLAILKKSWKEVARDEDFQYSFLDEALATAYQQEQRLGNIVRYASVLSIFIACMGLFGLVTLVVVRRTREIGIRKVLGANTSRIVTIISKEFIFLVILASLIAFPIAWWAINKWLEDFAFRVEIPWWIFPLAALVALFIALLTVSIQAIKAALMNPVKSLRTE